MISILASGYGHESLSAWLNALVCAPALLQLDARYESRRLFSSEGREYFEARLLLRCNGSLSLDQALPSTNSDWLLTLWCARKGTGTPG